MKKNYLRSNVSVSVMKILFYFDFLNEKSQKVKSAESLFISIKAALNVTRVDSAFVRPSSSSSCNPSGFFLIAVRSCYHDDGLQGTTNAQKKLILCRHEQEKGQRRSSACCCLCPLGVLLEQLEAFSASVRVFVFIKQMQLQCFEFFLAGLNFK